MVSINCPHCNSIQEIKLDNISISSHRCSNCDKDFKSVYVMIPVVDTFKTKEDLEKFISDKERGR